MRLTTCLLLACLLVSGCDANTSTHSYQAPASQATDDLSPPSGVERPPANALPADLVPPQ